MEALGGMMIGLWLGLVVLVIAWIIMPFAIIGTKPILRQVLQALQENNRLQREIKDRLGPPTVPQSPQAASQRATLGSP